MATAAENLDTAITQTTARIVEVTASSQPNYNIDGQMISKGTYLTQLTQTLGMLLDQLQRLDQCWQIDSYGRAI